MGEEDGKGSSDEEDEASEGSFVSEQEEQAAGIKLEYDHRGLLWTDALLKRFMEAVNKMGGLNDATVWKHYSFFVFY